jgi:hypothetical protein
MSNPEDKVASTLAASPPEWTVADTPLPSFLFEKGDKPQKAWRPKGKSPGWTKTFALLPREVCWIDRVDLQPPIDQDPCNSCTAFAMCAVMGDLAVIRSGGTATHILSPGFVHRCLGNCECSEALDPGIAARALMAHAVPPKREGDFPYPPHQCATAQGVLKISGFSPLRNEMEAKRALTLSPIFAVMDLWDDFWRFYKGGIYRQTTGPYLASHSIELVGYDDEQGCWYVKNSRGPAWGERGGFGRIAYGECSIFTPGGNGGLQLRI